MELKDMDEVKVDKELKQRTTKTKEEEKRDDQELRKNRKFNLNRSIYNDWQTQMNMSALEYIEHRTRPSSRPLTNDSRSGKFPKENHWVCYSKTVTPKVRTYVIAEDYLRTAVMGPKSNEKVFEREFIDSVKSTPNRKFSFNNDLRERLVEMVVAFGMTDVKRIEKIKFDSNTNKWRGLTFGNKGVVLKDTWIKVNITEAFPNWWKANVGDDNDKNPKIYEWTTLPLGSSHFSNKDLPVDGYQFKYSQKLFDDNCAVINLANVVERMGLSKVSDHLQKYFSKDALANMNVIDMIQSVPKDRNLMKMMKVLMNHLKFDIKKAQVKDIFKINNSVPLCVRMHAYHCVVIWNNEIYDANHTHTLPLNIDHMDWCSGHDIGFVDVVDAFYFYPRKKVCIALNLPEKKDFFSYL